MPASRLSLPFPYRFSVGAIIVIGFAVGIIAFRELRQAERQRIVSELGRRASLRHALTSEVLRRYEDSLFGVSTLFMLDRGVTESEFTRATSRLEARMEGAQAFEWVPLVAQRERTAAESAFR